MPTLSLVQQICVWIIPILLAITLHEAAHAYVANALGDTTAKALGRLSLNPIRHIDLFGTIILPLMVGILSQFTFVIGWAKPVPISTNQLRHPKRDMALVSFAGPLSNLIMVLLWTSVLKLTLIFSTSPSSITLFLMLAARAGIIVNLLLAFFNLLPLPPLDGSKVLASFLSPRHALAYLRLEPYGFIILIALVYLNVLSQILTPLIQSSLSLLQTVFNL